MTNANPYSLAAADVAANATADERATFLKKVYSLLLAGVLGFAATLWAAGSVPFVNEIAVSFGRMIYGQRFGMLIYMGIFIAGSWAVHAVAEKRPINAIAYAAWVVLLGLLIAPIVLFVSATQGVAVVNQASMITAVTFLGLTGVVYVTGSDFSFLRGALGLLGGLLLAVFLAGWLFGFSMGLWGSAALVALFAGYILYDTGQVMRTLPTTMAMSGAIMLFTDVVLFFKNVLIMLSSNRD